jgi:hypothetical protein
MRFRFKRIPTPEPVVPLGGNERPRSMIAATLIGPEGQYVKDAVLDTGADDTLFPEKAAQEMGIDLRQALRRTARGVGGKRIHVRYAQVTLRLTDGSEFLEWLGWVAFTSAPLERPLLGYAGCLQFFTAMFHGDSEEVRLSVNRSYPGMRRRR